MDSKGLGKTIIDFLTGNLLFYVFYYPRKYYVEREVFFANEFNVPISYSNFRRFMNEVTGLSNIDKYEISITDDIAQDPDLLLSLLKANPSLKEDIETDKLHKYEDSRTKANDTPYVRPLIVFDFFVEIEDIYYGS